MIKKQDFILKVILNILNIENSNPGPGTYQMKSIIDGSGITHVSRFKSSTAKSFSGRYQELSNKNPSKKIILFIFSSWPWILYCF